MTDGLDDWLLIMIMLIIWSWESSGKLQSFDSWKGLGTLDRDGHTNIFFQENALKYVFCKMGTILFHCWYLH